MNTRDHGPDTEDDGPHIPRVALMGEFSAGKSTLTNLLLGAEPLPVKITATRLPPVWITKGTGKGLREDLNGDLHELDDSGLENIRMDDTRLIQLQMDADILNLCDLVDMPGISDPNMKSEVWRHVIDQADILVWCTHATQAWRQSEAAAFDSLPEHLRKRAILLITRSDKLQNERDRNRVMSRLVAETEDRFLAIYPVSLLDAVLSGEDRSRWEKSGAEPFVRTLVQMITKPDAPISKPESPAPHATRHAPDNVTSVRPTRVAPSAEGTRRARPEGDARRTLPDLHSHG
jgi:GTP-binding protein EngB required for normal cell division